MLNKLLKYTLVGGLCALINWAIFYVLLHFDLHYLIAGLISFIIATMCNFWLAKWLIFKHYRHSLFKETFVIYLVSFLGLLIDIFTLFICVQIFQISAMLSKILASGVAFIFNFSIRNFVVYKEKK